MLWGSLLAVAALYLLSRTQRGQVVASDAVEFVTVTAQRIANEAWRITKGLRNRNPGNLRFIAPSRAYRGQVSDDGTGFGVYESDELGVRALGQTLLAYDRRGINTVRAIISTYAPASENDTASYVRAVSRALMVTDEERVSVLDRLPEFALAIIKHENGVQPYAVADVGRWVYA